MRRVRQPPVGSLEWENLGGPSLSLAQRITLLAGTAAVLLASPQIIDHSFRTYYFTVRDEARRNHGCRFACFGPIVPTAVRLSTFSSS